MRSLRLSCVLSLIALGILQGQLSANPVAKSVFREVLESVIRKEGKSAMSHTGLEAMENTMIRYSSIHGPEAITRLTTTGGTNFLRGLEKYKGEFIDLSMKLSDDGVRVLSRKCDHLMPLAKKFGPEIVELEAKAPGVHSLVIKHYGPESLELFARKIPSSDITHLLQLAERAKDKTAKDMIVKTYVREGRSFFEKIPPKLVIAVGVGGGLVFIAKGVGDGAKAVGEGVKDGIEIISHPVGKSLEQSFSYLAAFLGFIFVAGSVFFAWLCLSSYLLHKRKLTHMMINANPNNLAFENEKCT